MLYTIAAVLIILWLLGIVMVLVDLISGRRRAIQALHGKEIGTRTLTVSEARPPEEPAG